MCSVIWVCLQIPGGSCGPWVVWFEAVYKFQVVRVDRVWCDFQVFTNSRWFVWTVCSVTCGCLQFPGGPCGLCVCYDLRMFTNSRGSMWGLPICLRVQPRNRGIQQRRYACTHRLLSPVMQTRAFCTNAQGTDVSNSCVTISQYPPPPPSILFYLIFLLNVQKWRVVHRYMTGFTTAMYVSFPNFRSKLGMSIIFQVCSDCIETRLNW